LTTKSVLIFSGNNQRAVIAFCRYAAQEDIPFEIVANGEDDTIFQSSYSNRVIAIREKNRVNLSELVGYCELAKEKSQVNEILILPSTEYLNRFLLNHKNELESKGIQIGLCDESIYSLVSNKLSFSKLCQSFSIPVPQEFKSIPKSYPFVIKPKEYGNGLTKVHEKPILVFSKGDFENLERIENISDYYFQEYIDGASYYLLYHFSKSGETLAYSQENLIQQDEGASMILARSSTIHKEEISKQFIKLFKEISFHGLVMVEVKFDGDKFVMIEANPRLWGPSQLILDSGMMLFDAFSKANGLKNELTEREYRVGEYYFWSGGLISNFKKRKSPKFYKYDSTRFYSDYHLLMKHDIYLRKDTLTIYINEVS
jgi:predicted ATP-grasp superfamily ATP-dependent carboligase